MGEEEDDDGAPLLPPLNANVASDPSDVAVGKQGQDAGPMMTALTPLMAVSSALSLGNKGRTLVQQ